MNQQNKLDALREKSTAEQIMTRGEDYSTAMEHLRRAGKLFPGLDDIESLTAACEILSAIKIPGSGGVDHYWILGIDPSSSFSDVRSRVDELTNLLQPIKKKQTYSGFAGRVFALLENALLVLTDREKRIEFDRRRNQGFKGCEMINYDGCSVMGNWYWSVKDLVGGQIWGVYGVESHEYSPAREYVRFEKLISGTQAAVTYLEAAGVLDHEVKASRERLPISCGMFRITQRSCIIDLSRFSFCVRYEQQGSGLMCYKIFPQKGQMWAMYGGWNTKWGASEYKSSKWIIVQVDSGITEMDGGGILVTRMEEVEGCYTFGCRCRGMDASRVIPRANLLCFSHRIPAFKVPGISAEETWQLSPNALP
ncbi:hypothetical protein LINGRAHAP2_LOCUS29396 [Linum grandiflorum]